MYSRIFRLDIELSSGHSNIHIHVTATDVPTLHQRLGHP